MRRFFVALSLTSLLAAQDAETRPSLRLRAVPARPAAGRLHLKTERTVGYDGVVATEITATFSNWEYEAYKSALGSPEEVLRRLLPASPTALEAAPPSAAFDDAKGALVLRRTELGDVGFESDGARTLRVEEGLSFEGVKAAGGRPAARFAESGTLFGLAFAGEQTVAVPPASSDVTYDPATRTLRWRPMRVATPPAPAKLAFRISAAERLLSGAYKAYGFPGPHWAGRVVVTNKGPSRITNLRLRHRVEGYSEWSPWDKLADVAPGETAVVRLHPVLAAATAQLKSDTPANLLVEWTYVDGDGKERADADAARLVLLGGNEFVFARSGGKDAPANFADAYDNASLLAAWVSRDDAIVREVAALGAKRAGGAAANEGVYAAIATLKGLYETLVANDVTYQHPPSLTDPTLSFVNRSVQNVKYPRDVLRDRSGTCIDLAILYASLLHATGLPAYLCVVPGHCFPAAGMPDGTLAAVEVTGVSGGGRMGSAAATFGEVYRYGREELERALKGPHVLVDLRHAWTHGVSCPELPPVGPDFVRKEPLREKIPPEKQRHLAEMRAEAVKDFEGRHDVALKDAAGGSSAASLRIAASVDAKTFLIEMKSEGTLPTDDGKTLDVSVVQVFEGVALMNHMRCLGLHKTAVVKGTGAAIPLPPDAMTLAAWPEGVSGELSLANPGGEPETIAIERPKA